MEQHETQDDSTGFKAALINIFLSLMTNVKGVAQGDKHTLSLDSSSQLYQTI